MFLAGQTVSLCLIWFKCMYVSSIELFLQRRDKTDRQIGLDKEWRSKVNIAGTVFHLGVLVKLTILGIEQTGLIKPELIQSPIKTQTKYWDLLDWIFCFLWWFVNRPNLQKFTLLFRSLLRVQDFYSYLS